MTAAVYWGEERDDDALFAVYLRKVRYVSPNGSANDSGFAEEINAADQLQWETVKERVIKAGSRTRLVDALLTADGGLDARHFSVFFATFRAFASTFCVVRLLLSKYSDAVDCSHAVDTPSAPRPAAVLDGVRTVLLNWLELHPEDFDEPPSFTSLTELAEFCRHHAPHLHDTGVACYKLRESFCKHGSARHSLRNCRSRSMERQLGLRIESLDSFFTTALFKPAEITDKDAEQIAKQLTYWDAELFKQLLPYECQGCFWLKRDRKSRRSRDRVRTVRATIDQFNAVSKRVMTSVVVCDCSAAARAKILLKWLAVARELRLLKNFSSLKAVVAGLECEAVYRLKSVWNLVPAAQQADFRQLSDLISESSENGLRKLLDQEGTGKSASPEGKENGKRTFKRYIRTKSDMSLCQGTVPFLGTFLTDLTMLHAANPDFIDEKLVNFEKRRKEFEVLAKIKLYQSAARNYNLAMDQQFCVWFRALPCLTESECLEKSFKIEARLADHATPELRRKEERKASTLSRMFRRGEGRPDVDEDAVSVGDCRWYLLVPEPELRRKDTAALPPCIAVAAALPSRPPLVGSEFDPRRMRPLVAGHQQNPSTASSSSYETNAVSRLPTRAATTTGELRRVLQSSCSMPLSLSPKMPKRSTSQPPPLPPRHSPDAPYVVAVGLDDDAADVAAGANYKCIRLGNGDRMSEVVGRALDKHLIDAPPDDYCLVQLLRNGDELVLPEKCNPFYAVVTSAADNGRLTFVLRRRQSGDGPAARLVSKKRKERKRTRLMRWSSGTICKTT